jgi:dTMP kinase
MKSDLLTELPGKLVAVEGLDGSGKSTQLYLLKRWLELQGLRVFFTEWNSSVIVKKATSKGKKRQLLTPTTFSLIHCTDFADRYERQILPLLKAGYLVLCDRYIYTAFARDAVRGCSPTWLHNLYGFARRPDLTLFFDTPLPVALARILAGRPQLKYHEAGMDLGLSPDPYESFRLFQERIYNEYLALRDGCGFITINGSATVEEQQKEVRAIVVNSFDLPSYRWRSIA